MGIGHVITLRRWRFLQPLFAVSFYLHDQE
jgi:hypothetical protein